MKRQIYFILLATLVEQCYNDNMSISTASATKTPSPVTAESANLLSQHGISATSILPEVQVTKTSKLSISAEVAQSSTTVMEVAKTSTASQTMVVVVISPSILSTSTMTLKNLNKSASFLLHSSSSSNSQIEALETVANSISTSILIQTTRRTLSASSTTRTVNSTILPTITPQETSSSSTTNRIKEVSTSYISSSSSETSIMTTRVASSTKISPTPSIVKMSPTQTKSIVVQPVTKTTSVQTSTTKLTTSTNIKSKILVPTTSSAKIAPSKSMKSSSIAMSSSAILTTLPPVPMITKTPSPQTKNNFGRIIAIALGIIVLLLLCAAILVWYKRRAKKIKRYRLYDDNVMIPGFTDYGGTVHLSELNTDNYEELDADIPSTGLSIYEDQHAEINPNGFKDLLRFDV